jgi:hypothetical protein
MIRLVNYSRRMYRVNYNQPLNVHYQENLSLTYADQGTDQPPDVMI